MQLAPLQGSRREEPKLATFSLFLTGKDTGDVEVPKETELRDIPLHSSTSEEPPRVFTPVDTQLAATVTVLANAGVDKTRQGEGVYVGEGLPPVPQKLVKRIRSGEYVEMEELLPEMCTRDDAEPEAKRHCSRRSPDIFTWLQCFGVYTSIRGAQFPELITELMAYMGTIIRVNREYTGSEWAKYDMLFHKHAALRRETRWSVINPTIYARCFTAATRSPPRCEVCLASTHDTRECSQRDVDEGDIEGRLRNMERTIQNLPPLPPRNVIQFSGEVCRKWNKGECRYAYCRHTHVCSSCGGAHPAVRCSRRGRMGAESKPAPWGSRQNPERP